MLGKVLQCLLDRVEQLVKGREVAVVGSTALDCTPEELDRIVVRGVAGQVVHRQASGMLLHAPLHLSSAVVEGIVLHEKERLVRLCQHLAEEGDAAVSVELAFDALEEQTAAGKLDQAEGLVSFAFAHRLDQRLLSHRSPGVAQRPPLGEAGLGACGWPSLKASKADARLTSLTSPALYA